MSILYKSTPEEQRRAFRDDIALKIAEAANNLASVARSGYEAFWAVDPQQLVADLNADLASSLAMLAANSSFATVINAQLNALNLPEFPARIPDAMPPGFAFDGTSFRYTPPV